MADLPPLNALRAFEAAARHLNFTRAGEELHVTHGAVSRQIKVLETFLGRELFIRRPRGLDLTAQGRQLAYTVAHALEELRRTVADVRLDTRQQVITVNTVPSLAARWLVPRIADYQARHPGMEIRVATSHALTDFSRDDVDIALRYGRPPWTGLHSEQLFDFCLSPVCAPSLTESGALREPADLARFTLLHDMSYAFWVRWLERAGVQTINARTGPVLEDTNVLLQAAIEGQGVALAPLPLVHADLKAGRLVRPFEVTIPVDITFHIVCRPERRHDPLLAPFIDWLHAEAARVSH